jgi:hypothetical protein
MALEPQDIVVLLKLAVSREENWSYPWLGESLKMSPSEVEAAIERATDSRLMNIPHRRPIRAALEDFCVHGIQYVFPAKPGRVTYGMPTAHAAAPLKDELIASDALPPVWPDSNSRVRGKALEPLYRSVPDAARKDDKLYAALALVDAIRMGRARERKRAAQLLHVLLTA